MTTPQSDPTMADSAIAISDDMKVSERTLIAKLGLPFKWIFIALIWLYRYTLGVFLGGSCRFEPSCSHYAEEALHKHGVFKGLYLTARRLLKCNPWGPFGPDPVP